MYMNASFACLFFFINEGKNSPMPYTIYFYLFSINRFAPMDVERFCLTFICDIFGFALYSLSLGFIKKRFSLPSSRT